MLVVALAIIVVFLLLCVYTTRNSPRALNRKYTKLVFDLNRFDMHFAKQYLMSKKHIDSLKQDLESVNAVLKSEHFSGSTATASIAAALANIKTKMDTLKNTNVTLVTQIDKLNKEVADAKAVRTNLEAEQIRLTGLVTAGVADSAALKADIANKNTLIAQRDSQIASLNTQLATIDAQAQATIDQIQASVTADINALLTA
jgi:chromosome segregation ATPase